MADRMAVLSRGKIGQVGTPEEVYRDPVSGYVAGFIGETNLMEGEVVEVHAGGCAVKVGGVVIEGRVTVGGWAVKVGDGAVVSIRPEAWRLHRVGGKNEVAGMIVERSYLGQRIEYFIETVMGRQQVVEMNPQVLRGRGEKVVMYAEPRDVVIFPKI